MLVVSAEVNLYRLFRDSCIGQGNPAEMVARVLFRSDAEPCSQSSRVVFKNATINIVSDRPDNWSERLLVLDQGIDVGDELLARDDTFFPC